jgi:RING finger family protein
MQARSLITFAAAAFLMALIQFFSALCGIEWAVAVSLLLPFGTLGLMKFFETDAPAVWMVMIPVASSSLGVLIWTISHPAASMLFWICPLLAWLLMGGVVWWRNRDARRCTLCNCRLSGKVAFECPRCGLTVCEQNCWDFVRIRCRLCVQNQVPVFPLDGRWWDKIFGPATPHGRCQLCQTSGQETELRGCPTCGRPQCRQCWDDANGVCSRCKWVVKALPEALKGYMS